MDTIAITGASSGIGAATAIRLATRRNLALILTGRDPKRLDEIVTECRDAGVSVQAMPSLDLRREQDRGRFLVALKNAKDLRGIVNSAGLGIFGPSETYSSSDWDNIISTNLTSVFELCRRSIPFLAAVPGTTTIVNVSSDADSVGFPNAAAYCASKAGLLGLSRALQMELRGYGIRVTVISPGRVDTRFNNKEPGMRPGALLAEDVAEVIEFMLFCNENIEIREVRLDSMLG